nr:hypothetical protein [Tanacetum cinerariifolium]
MSKREKRKKGKGRKETAATIFIEVEVVMEIWVGKENGIEIMIVTETKYGRERYDQHHYAHVPSPEVPWKQSLYFQVYHGGRGILDV